LVAGLVRGKESVEWLLKNGVWVSIERKEENRILADRKATSEEGTIFE